MADLPSSAQEAQAQNSAQYFTGKPCAKGHISPRYTSSRGCVACSGSQSQRWRANNPELAKEQTRRNLKQWRKNNLEHSREYDRNHYWLNREAHREQKARRYTNNKAEIIAKVTRWQSENYDKVRVVKARRYAAKLRAAPAWASPNDAAPFYAIARGLSACTGEDYHVDHIVPLKSVRLQSLCGNLMHPRQFIGPLLPVVQGFHCAANFQILHGVENASKGNKKWPDMPYYESL